LNDVEQRLIRLVLCSLITALLSALCWFWLEVATMSELSLKNALSVKAWSRVLFETQFGRVWQIRLGLIAAVFVLVASALAQVKARRTLIVILWLVSVVLLASLAWISHAAAATGRPFAISGDMFHLCAAGLWIGGLAPLTIFLACVRGSLSLGETVVRVVRRFSTLSLWCVTVLIATGASNSWLLVGSVHALFTTPYGRLLLVKLTLFGILLSFGVRNRFLVKAKLPNLAADPYLLSQLRRNVVCEIYLGVAVVVIVACLGVTPPAISMMHTMK
jgi:putative copper resistance protein D